MTTICVFTGTRAEYGLLKPVIASLLSARANAPLLVTGAHLSPAHGLTVREIEADGFPIAEAVEILLDSDTPDGVATAFGLGAMRFAGALGRIRPDCLLILGDRYEALAAAIAATIVGVPVAHIHGGELTLGAMDDAFRHAVTKMSCLHFTSTPAYRDRVVQLGEEPSRVHCVGALGVQNARGVALLDRAATLARLGLAVDRPFLLVTFHPATLEREPPRDQVTGLLQALEAFPDHAIVFTGANADAGGREVNGMLQAAANADPARIMFRQSLGLVLYLSAARAAAAVVGNSSSGIIEVPSFGVPTVDIGSRQAGRVRSPSVIHCDATAAAITDAIRHALTPGHLALAAREANPYEGGDTAGAIARILVAADFGKLSRKTFHDIAAPDAR